MAASGKKDPERERRRAGAASPEFSSISTRRWQLQPEGLEAAGPALRQVNDAAMRPLRRPLAAAGTARSSPGRRDYVSRT